MCYCCVFAQSFSSVIITAEVRGKDGERALAEARIYVVTNTHTHTRLMMAWWDPFQGERKEKRENENDCKDKSKSEVSAVYLLMQISAHLSSYH